MGNGSRIRSLNKSGRLAVAIASGVRKPRARRGSGAGLLSPKASFPETPLLPKVPQPFKRVPPAGDHQFQHTSLWSSLHLQAPAVAWGQAGLKGRKVPVLKSRAPAVAKCLELHRAPCWAFARENKTRLLGPSPCQQGGHSQSF